MKNKLKIISILILFFALALLFSTKVYAEDYQDDLYTGDYSIEDMIRNTTVVTFGKQDYDPNLPYAMYTGKGALKLFHSAGNILVNGNVFNMRRLDMKGYSYVSGRIMNSLDYYSTTNSGTIYAPESYWCGSGVGKTTVIGNYINFDRLYDSVTSEQQRIKKGRKLNANEFTLHIPIGGSYYIDDISEVHDIIFDNFEKNRDELTVITINNSGVITFPQLFRNDDYDIIPTNDYIGMARPQSGYGGNYVLDTYYGNIVWNFPNARYIKFSSGAPIVGHFIAPNADVEGLQDLHFAGTMLVNGLCLQGSSEAHYYPLTSRNIPNRNTLDNYIAKARFDPQMGNVSFKGGIDPNLLEEGTIVEFDVVAEDNYELVDVKIEEDNGNVVGYKKTAVAGYEFEMPSSDVTIIATFNPLKAPEEPEEPTNEVNEENIVETENVVVPENEVSIANTIKEEGIAKIVEIIKNPETGDQIRKYLSIGFLGLLSILMIYSIKKKYSTKKSNIQY